MFTDLPLDQLRTYTSAAKEPSDFDAFWQATIEESRAKTWAPTLERQDVGLTAIDVFDVTFAGFDGQQVRAWLRIPAGSDGPLPTVVQYVGYGGGRGHALENLAVAASGFAHFQMDTRGQGSSWSSGVTDDLAPASGPQVPGVMTKGIGSRETYYYRRLMTDAVLAVDAARSLDVIDGDRIGVMGGSQGGALSLAAAALGTRVRAAAVNVPFLADFPRAITITDAYPFREVTDYLATHRDKAPQVLETLAYFDSVNFARRAKATARFSVGLMDQTSPPSTVFAAYNAYAGDKQIAVWPYNGHEAGGIDDDANELAFLRANLG